MAKPTEKMLYSAYLDAYYSTEIYKNMISELNESLKGAKQDLKKSEKLLAQATKRYEEVYGRKPTAIRNN